MTWDHRDNDDAFVAVSPLPARGVTDRVLRDRVGADRLGRMRVDATLEAAR